MQIIRKLGIATFAMALTLSSCGDKKTGGTAKEAKVLTPEEHKAKLNDIGIDFINDMDAMSDESMVSVLQNFFDLSDTYDLGNNIDVNSAPLSYLKQFTVLDESPEKAISLKSISEDNYNSFSEVYKDLTGIYEFNFEAEKWVKSFSASEVVFKFPSAQSKSSNDAMIRIYGYDAVAASQQDFEDFTYELIKSIKMELKVDGKDLFGMEMNATYHSDDVPKTMMTRVSMENYSWENSMDFSNPSNGMSAKSTYKKGDKVIAEFSFNAKGDFTYDNIESDLTAFDESDREYPQQDVLESGQVYFQVENLKLIGEVDVKALFPKLEEAEKIYNAGSLNDYGNYVYDEKAYIEAITAAINEHTALSLIYADNEQKIGSIEYYADEYQKEQFNGVSYAYVTGYDVGVRAIFEDGSAVSETYFDDGFSKLIDRMNKMIDKINRQYDAGLENVK